MKKVFDYHYVITVGYYDTGIPSNDQLYVNSGWSSHGFVWIAQSYAYKQISVV